MTRSWRGVVKAGLAAGLQFSGAHAVFSSRRGKGPAPLVVGYHMVVDDVRPYAERAIPSNLISAAALEQQLDWIGRRYRFVPLDELGERMAGGAPFERPAAAVTFDDGYVGVYEHAFPLLRRKGIPAGMFVVTDSIDSEERQLYDRLYLLLARMAAALGYSTERLTGWLAGNGVPVSPREGRNGGDQAWNVMRRLFTTLPQQQLKPAVEALEAAAGFDGASLPHLRSMTWEMLQTLSGAGMTIGSHTRTHALLTLEDGPTVRDQTAGSARALADRLGGPVLHFAYPDGRFNPAVVASVEAAGYRFAYTTCRHRDPRRPLLTIPRKLLWENSCLDGRGSFSPALMTYLASPVSDLLAPCRQDHRGTASAAAPPAHAGSTRRPQWGGLPEC